MKLTSHRSELLFMPLGGAGEIGLNLNVYHLDGKYLIVDFGAGFADDFFPGIDMLVPDVRFLQQHAEDILGIVLTHSHEDHIGAVQYVWGQLACPIYTTKFTANFLRAKIDRLSIADKIIINEINPSERLELGPFSIDFTPLTHSTAEMNGLMIRTRLGNIFHTGDWKFDDDPIIGQKADEEALKKLGDEGILALIGDSTNVFSPGTSGSEGELATSLAEIVAGCKQLVCVTTFASNVARVQSIADAAIKAGRRVAVLGRSLWRIIDTAQSSGYLEGYEFLTDNQLKGVARDKLLVICTGCQGEYLAAAAKLANNQHPTLRLKRGDTMIFSSKIIPGNEKSIFRLFNSLVEMGVEVMTEKEHFVHVSGHPCRDELARMYQLLRPQMLIPVHGEIVHMHEHAKFAVKHGAKRAVEIRNGQVMLLSDNKGRQGEVIGEVPFGCFGVDGATLVHEKSPVLKMRRRLRSDGAAFIQMVFDKKLNLLSDPYVTLPGLLDDTDDTDLLDALRGEVVDQIKHYISTNRQKADLDTIENIIRSSVRRFAKAELGKSPAIFAKAVAV